MTGSEFQRQLRRIEARFNKEFHQEQVKLMWNRLKNFPANGLDLAVENIICEEKHFPAFNEIRDHLKRVMAAHPRLKMENTSEAKVVVHCSQCEDSGIRLRSRRRDMVRDYYCNCAAAGGLSEKFDWTASPWREILNRPPGISAREFGAMLRKASRTLKPRIVTFKGDTETAGELPF